MPTLEELLKQKEAELSRVQKEVEALRVAVRLMALAGTTNGANKAAGQRLSQPSMARAVLSTANREMHVKEIAEGIRVKFDEDIKPAYLAPVMYRQIDKLFYKSDAPNTFGLLEWKTSDKNSAAA